MHLSEEIGCVDICLLGVVIVSATLNRFYLVYIASCIRIPGYRCVF